jgi:rubrerythrin
MRKLSQEGLEAAFVRESQAVLNYIAFAERADREGRPQVARLFRAVAASERAHAVGHLLALQQVGDSNQNVDVALAEESFQFEEFYPSYMEIAKNQKEEAAFVAMHRAMVSEKTHEMLFGRAKQALSDGRDTSLLTLWVCPVCGFFIEGVPPDTCPICSTAKELFEQY